MIVRITHGKSGKSGCFECYYNDHALDVCYGSDGVYVIYYDTYQFFPYSEISLIERTVEDEKLPRS